MVISSSSAMKCTSCQKVVDSVSSAKSASCNGNFICNGHGTWCVSSSSALLTIVVSSSFDGWLPFSLFFCGASSEQCFCFVFGFFVRASNCCRCLYGVATTHTLREITHTSVHRELSFERRSGMPYQTRGEKWKHDSLVCNVGGVRAFVRAQRK